MKVVICGDTHIGAVFGLGSSKVEGGNTRVDDYSRTLNYIADYCIKNNVDVFIQTGDVFDSRNPSPEHMDIFNNVLRKLSMAGVSSGIIMGNHDYRRSGNTFSSAISSLSSKHYSNIKIALEPEIIEIKKDNDSLNILLLPYRDRKIYGTGNTKSDSIQYEKEVSDLIKKCNSEYPIIAVGHNFFKEGSYSDYGGLEVLIRPSAFELCDMVVMGHYHTFKILKKKAPIAIYSGSMEKLNFGDKDINKYFIEYESLSKKVKIIKSPVRELINNSIDLSMYNIEDFWKVLKEELSKIDFSDKIVRYNIAIQGKYLGSIKKNEIRNILFEMGAYHISKITLEPVFNKLIRDSSVLEFKDDISRTKAFIETQPYDDDLKEKLCNEAKLIIGR